MLELHWLKSLFHFSTVLLCFFFALYLFQQGGKAKSRARYLGMFLVVLIIIEIGGLLNHIVWVEEWLLLNAPWILLLDNPFLLASVPFLLFYVFSSVHSDYRFTPIQYLHFVPSLISAIVYAYRLSATDSLEWPMAVSNREMLNQSEAIFLHFLAQLQFVVYSIWGAVISVRHGFRTFRPGLPRVLYGFILVRSVDLVEFSLYLITGEISVINWVLYIIYQLGLLTLLSMLFFDAVRDIKSFLGNGSPIKYQKTYLAPTRIAELKADLLLLIKNDKPHHDPLITLDKLSKRLSVPSYQLSQVINNGFGQNFFEFLSAYRIEDCKILLHETDLNIEEIMHQCGFNSKSVFNSAFKKITGSTPSAYRGERHSRID